MAWLYQRGKKWWLGWKANGKQFLRSTGTSDEKTAKAVLLRQQSIEQAAIEHRLTQAVIESYSTRAVPKVTLVAAMDEWLTECQGATAPRTLKKYRLVAGEFSEYLNAGPNGPLLRDIEADAIRGFLTRKQGQASSATVNDFRTIVSIFFMRCIRNGMLAANPVIQVKRFKPGLDENTKRRAFTLAEVKLLFEKANDFWRGMIALGFYCGCRLGDAVCMRWGSVDFTDRVIRWHASKTRQTVTVPMAPALEGIMAGLQSKARDPKPGAFIWPDEARRYLSNGSGWLSNDFHEKVLTPACLTIPRVNKKAHKRGRAAKRDITGPSFHSLRHSFVSALKVAGASQAVARELAGHSSDEISRIYTHLPPEALAAAVRELPMIDV
jgi:integrase